MYQTILLVLYVIVIIPSLSHLIRHRDELGSRRISAGLGGAGILLAPYAASFICELVIGLLNIAVFMVIVIFGFGLILRSIFR